MKKRVPHTIVAAFMAAVWILVPILAALHIAAEAHEYCADHGTLEESHDHAHALTGALASEEDESSNDELRSGSAPDSNDDGHTDCAFDEQATRDIAPFVVLLVVNPAPALTTKRTPALGSDSPATIELLLGAPKTSPPLAVS